MTVDFLATAPQYLHHLTPVWRALRGRGSRMYTVADRGLRRTVVVAGSRDAFACRQLGRNVVRMEHGAGFTYVGVEGHPSYP
ncbi:MAG: hypothetical protein ACRDHK_14525, partial [Actinomycetota bacterium]